MARVSTLFHEPTEYRLWGWFTLGIKSSPLCTRALDFIPRTTECMVRKYYYLYLLRTQSMHISEDLLSKCQTGRRIPRYENSYLHYRYDVLCNLQQPPALSCTSGEWSRLNQFAVSLLQRGRHYPLKLHDPSSLPLSLCCWTIATRITVVTVYLFSLGLSSVCALKKVRNPETPRCG